MSKMLKFIPLLFLITTVNSELGGSYFLEQTLLMYDNGLSSVGYKINGQLNIEKYKDVFKCVLQNLKLSVKSSKATSPDGFEYHGSKIEKLINKPFAFELKNGEIKNIYISEDEDSAMINIKKGILSLFQFKKNGQFEEKDTSGLCKVNYETKGNVIIKNKYDCQYPGKTNIQSRLWGTKVNSVRNTEILISKDYLIEQILAKEEHKLISTWSKIMQIMTVTSTQLKIIDRKIVEKSQNVQNIEKESGIKFKKYDFALNEEKSEEAQYIELSKFVKMNKNAIENEIGTSESAMMFLEGIKVAHKFTHDSVYKYLTSKKNQNENKEQILDILGSKPTPEMHKTIMKFLSKEENINYWERYLWALSINPNPPFFIIQELFKMGEKEHKSEQVWETIVLTIPALVYRYTQKDPDNKENDKLIKQTINFLTNKLSICKDDEIQCQKLYLRAFSNIPSHLILNKLLEFKKVHNKKIVVDIMNAIERVDSKHWNNQILDMTEEIYLANSTYESTARIIALNILIKAKINDDNMLMKILSVLKHDDISRELQQYLLVSLEQLYESNKDLEKKVQKYLYSNNRNNYDKLSLSGFSTKFYREFTEGGKLSTIQEIVNGVLVSGVVNVDLFTEEYEKTAFSFGLFSRGLGSLMNSEEQDVNETPTAGMQLRIMDVNLRPFVLFSGSGELMGHVMSGTASTLTPAYQALVLLDDDKLKLPLGIGHNIDISFLSGASADLSGQIEISLWYKTAKTLVQNKVGLAFEGKMELNLPFVKTEVDFNLNATPELFLTSSLSFYERNAMCLQLNQPSMTVNFNSHKFESITESKYRIKQSRKLKIPITARSYSLTRMNNAMCNILAKQGWFDES